MMKHSLATKTGTGKMLLQNNCLWH